MNLIQNKYKINHTQFAHKSAEKTKEKTRKKGSIFNNNNTKIEFLIEKNVNNPNEECGRPSDGIPCRTESA